MINVNPISPVLNLLQMGMKTKTPSKILTGKRLWAFRLFKWGSFAIWWGFIIYLLINWLNG
jgi:hypothetical protein